jgi:predicted  nucleic acid-binding Zn-ribbon protein
MSEEIQYTVLADALRASVRQYEQINTLANQLDKIAGLATYETELVNKIASLNADVEKAKQAKQEATIEYDSYVERINGELAAMQEQAETIEKNAKAEAKEIKEKAKKTALNIEEDATADAKKIKEGALADLMSMNTQIAEAKMILNGINLDIEKAKADLNEQNGMLQAAKDKIKQLLGGGE